MSDHPFARDRSLSIAMDIDIDSPTLNKELSVGQYLVTQLRDRCNIRHIFGVPGDFSFALNDAIAEINLADNVNDRVQWIGNLNELNAAYAAEGYGRINGYAALNTTYMVGELSAINGIAGAFTHSVPIFHLVGMPETRNLYDLSNHHSMGYDHNSSFASCHVHESITTDAMTITSVDEAKVIIDYMIHSMMTKKKPVYLAIPKDICEKTVPPFKKDTKLRLPGRQAALSINKDFLHDVKSDSEITKLADLILEKISFKEGQDTTGAIAVGSFMKRVDPSAMPMVMEFIDKVHLPIVSFPDNKCTIPETHDRFVGMLTTFIPPTLSFACKLWKDKKFDASRIITIGSIFSDISPGYKEIFNDSVHLDLRKVRIGKEVHYGVPLLSILRKLIERSAEKFMPGPSDFKPWPEYPGKPLKDYLDLPYDPNVLDFSFITQMVADHVVDGDLVYCDIGTIMMGISAQRFDKKVQFEIQTQWCSIGNATPGAFGAALARRHRGSESRTVLATGEGSHLMTIQNLACYFRYTDKLTPLTIINIDNGGYTIEKLLTSTPSHIQKIYNDLPIIDYPTVAKGFAGITNAAMDRWILASVDNVKDFKNHLEEARTSGKNLYITVKIDELSAPEPAKYLVDVMYS